MDTTNIITLAIVVVLAIERIFNKVKHCQSGCCELDMKEEKSPTNKV
jgi:hypothetical protein